MSKFDQFVQALDREVGAIASRGKAVNRRAPRFRETHDLQKSIQELTRLGAAYTQELLETEAQLRLQRQAVIMEKLASIRDRVFQAVVDGQLTADEAAKLENLLNSVTSQQHDRLQQLTKDMAGRKIESVATGGAL